MKMRLVYCLFFAAIYLSPFPIYALETEKLTLNNNMTIIYNKLPPEAETFPQVFSKGIFYARIRSNMFYYNFDLENYTLGGKNKNHKIMGIGGSLIYKTAPFEGFSTTLGIYTSQNPWFFREGKADAGFIKSGKDTFSRNKIKNGGSYDGSYGMTVLGQAYLQFDFAETSLFAGRQLFESVFTASNDTKMIPNTFDGISADIKAFPDSRIQLAYFTAQKLRDHTYSHDVIAFDSWNENDDGGVNRSLNKTLVGTNNRLFIISANTKKINNLDATVSYLLVPDIISNITLETHYKIPLGEWFVIPGMRFMLQRDHLNTNVPVANLIGLTNGYHDPDSLDGWLYAAKVDLKKGSSSFRLGYSKVSDDADIINPWRGFPTSGYTRAMSQYNWQANTECFLIRFDYDFGKAGLVPGLKMFARYVIQDFDDLKTGVQPDSNVFNMDIFKKLANNFEMKFRFGWVKGDKNIYTKNGTLKTDISYSEYRLEFNYFL
jgi:hypothetical protein